MQRVVAIMVLIAVLLSGCAGRSGNQPMGNFATEEGAITEGYPMAQSHNAVESNADTQGYPPQEGSTTEAGLGSPHKEITNLVERLSSEAPPPEHGAGLIYGVLYSVSNQTPIPNTMVYLVKTSGESSDTLPNIIVGPSTDDIILHSDQDGAIVRGDIPPGNYFLIMSAPPYDWAEGYSDAEAEKPLLIQVRENEKTSMGIIYIFWP